MNIDKELCCGMRLRQHWSPFVFYRCISCGRRYDVYGKELTIEEVYGKDRGPIYPSGSWVIHDQEKTST